MPDAQQEHSFTAKTLVIVPWLEGGGAQGALEGILRQLTPTKTTLLILFRGNRNHDSAKRLAGRTIELDLPRSPIGVLEAALRLLPHIRKAETVYSLMRGSHLVLGMLPVRLLKRKKLAATFHQLPSQDAKGAIGQLEDVLVRRGIRHAGLITAPSTRAVEELIDGNYGPAQAIKVEHNIIKLPDAPPVRPRAGILAEVRLVFAGRLSRQKGLDRLPELLANVKIPVHVRYLGDGEERESIADLPNRLNAMHTLELFPHVEDVGAHLDWADALFMPSRWELNPLIVWEARARGRATIGSRIAAFQDLSSSGPLWLFDDADEFKGILSTLAAQPDVRVIAFHQALESSQNLSTRSAIVDYLGN